MKKFYEPDMVFDLFDFVLRTSRFVNNDGEIYETETYEVDTAKVHDEIILPIKKKLAPITERLKDNRLYIENVGPSDQYMANHPKYKGFMLVMSDYTLGRVHFAVEFKYGKLSRKLATIDYDADVDVLISTIQSIIFSYPRICEYIVGGKKYYDPYDKLWELIAKKRYQAVEGSYGSVLEPRIVIDVNGDGQILYDTGFYFDTSPIFGYPPMKYFERTELKKLAEISRIKMKPINGYKVSGSSKYISKAKYLCLDNALMYVVYHEWKKAIDELYEFTKYECKDAYK